MIIDKFIKIAIFFGTTAIILGALGAHSLKEILSSENLTSFNTGVKYQIYHSFLILILSLNHKKFNHKLIRSLVLITIGVILFSSSIYLLSLQKIINFKLSFLGPITPIGGTLLIIGWINLLFAIKNKS